MGGLIGGEGGGVSMAGVGEGVHEGEGIRTEVEVGAVEGRALLPARSVTEVIMKARAEAKGGLDVVRTSSREPLVAEMLMLEASRAMESPLTQALCLPAWRQNGQTDVALICVILSVGKSNLSSVECVGFIDSVQIWLWHSAFGQ